MARPTELILSDGSRVLIYVAALDPFGPNGESQTVRIALSEGHDWKHLPLLPRFKTWEFKSWLRFDALFVRLGMPQWPPTGIDSAESTADGFRIRFCDERIAFEPVSYKPWKEAEWQADWNQTSKRWRITKLAVLEYAQIHTPPSYELTDLVLLPSMVD